MNDPTPDPDDTIVAISTPPGRGGIGVVRLSGPRAIPIARLLFRPLSGGGTEGEAPGDETGRARLGRFVSDSGEPIDEGYLVIFRPPRSFTGEETAELWGHGSPAALRSLLEEAVARGARPAGPGEFTLRAFLRGRIDLTRAEAIHDLVAARTGLQARAALGQAMGGLAARVDHLKERLAGLLARSEAAIEFSEEAEAERFAPDGGLAAAAGALRRELEALAASYERGRRVRDGAAVALAGAPNVGKSSLFNRLLEEERAIVTPVAGTTRDLLEECLDLGGIPVRLLDTAGLQTVSDAPGAEGVRRARQAIDAADLILLVLDWSRPPRDEELSLLRAEERRTLVVLNKCDLPCAAGAERVLYLRKRHDALAVSARTGEGVADLRRRIEEAVGGASGAGEGEFLTNVRHRDLVAKAAAALGRAEGALRDRLGEECAAIDLRQALDRLGEITGAVPVERIYERIFREFCIGK
jgi:tRNA modification GTPase